MRPVRITLLRAVFTLAALVLAACALGPAAPAPANPAPPAAPAAPPAPLRVDFEVTISENPYRFVPAEFTLERGKTYTFRVKGAKEFHTFTIDALGVDQPIDPGKTVTVTVKATKAGDHKLRCIPHEALGQVGVVRVK